MLKWIEAIPYTETRAYVQRVIENSVVYDSMRGDAAAATGDPRLALSWEEPPGLIVRGNGRSAPRFITPAGLRAHPRRI